MNHQNWNSLGLYIATRINAIQWPKQYPHEKSPPKRGLFPFIHSRKGANNFISATVKDIDAVTIDNRMTCLILKQFWQVLSASGGAVSHRAEHVLFNQVIINHRKNCLKLKICVK